MSARALAGLLVVALSAAACDSEPTGIEPVSTEQAELVADRGGNGAAASQRASLLTDVPVSLDGTAALLSVTEITRDETTGQLLVDGILRWEQAGTQMTEVFEGIPADLSRTAPAGAADASGMAIAMVPGDRGNNEPGVCDILFLDLGPIFLDLLGLTVDLSPIQLDLDAQPGPGNLLGNLLCAVTGLLDGGPFAALNNLLDRINSILDSVEGILGSVPTTGALEDGGIFEGTVSLTELALDEAGNLVGSGTLTGTSNQGGVLTEITQTFTDVVFSLGETATADPSGMVMAMVPGDRGNDEAGVCDILFLDLGPIFLDVLGLQVDLSPIELDVDAQRGPGNLLGNLLCAVVGLLDGGLLDLDGLSDLLDRITDLLG